jgi:Zn-dependent protease
VSELLWVFVQVNLGLMFFNLIPVYPLDGSHVLRGLLPAHLAYSYDQFMRRWGMMIMMLLIVAGRDVLVPLVSEPSSRLAVLLIGG